MEKESWEQKYSSYRKNTESKSEEGSSNYYAQHTGQYLVRALNAANLTLLNSSKTNMPQKPIQKNRKTVLRHFNPTKGWKVMATLEPEEIVPSSREMSVKTRAPKKLAMTNCTSTFAANTWFFNTNDTLQTPSPSEVHQYAPAYYLMNPAEAECITKLQCIAHLVTEYVVMNSECLKHLAFPSDNSDLAVMSSASVPVLDHFHHLQLLAGGCGNSFDCASLLAALPCGCIRAAGGCSLTFSSYHLSHHAANWQSETDWKKGSRGCSNCLIQSTYSVFQTERVRALSCLTPKGDGKAVHAPEQHPRDQVLHGAYK
ncbi:hypothetical protein Anapl_00209 [Anas platyrhynchos]|uniref:Uncharacterized protein n=1 Tax=Anas platyrhynchos TaxID=8839 RepID=R0LUS3_ANAPL|nr:hypothetical protein Anapl_00209 [Anas platyrhynchos]